MNQFQKTLILSSTTRLEFAREALLKACRNSKYSIQRRHRFLDYVERIDNELLLRSLPNTF